jgi:hypothetical protein
VERTLKTKQTCLLSPGPGGWRVTNGASGSRDFASFADAAAALPEDAVLHLALPCRAALFERLHLPSTDATELGGMARLQLEKNLPFPPEEITSTIDIVEKGETGSVVLAVAVNNPQLDLLCEPLRQQKRLPERVSVFAMHVAAACPADETVLAVWREEGELVLAVVEKGKLGFAHVTAAATGDELAQELQPVLLNAELDGIPTNFSRVQIDSGCAEFKDALTGFFKLPVATFSVAGSLPEPAASLAPAHWREERKHLESVGRIKSRLIMAAVVYALFVVLAVGWVSWLSYSLHRLNAQSAALQPEVDFVQSRKGRWLALAPALDPRRYTVELLHQAFTSLPSEEIRITQFDQTPSQFKIEGEAPSANLAIEYGEQLKKNEALKDFAIEVGSPAILPNDHAQFRIFGKL